jgi:hypothetical protein
MSSFSTSSTHTGLVIEAAHTHRTSLKNPPKTVEEYLDSLESQGLTQLSPHFAYIYFELTSHTWAARRALTNRLKGNTVVTTLCSLGNTSIFYADAPNELRAHV